MDRKDCFKTATTPDGKKAEYIRLVPMIEATFCKPGTTNHCQMAESLQQVGAVDPLVRPKGKCLIVYRLGDYRFTHPLTEGMFADTVSFDEQKDGFVPGQVLDIGPPIEIKARPKRGPNRKKRNDIGQKRSKSSPRSRASDRFRRSTPLKLKA